MSTEEGDGEKYARLVREGLAKRSSPAERIERVTQDLKEINDRRESAASGGPGVFYVALVLMAAVAAAKLAGVLP